MKKTICFLVIGIMTITIACTNNSDVTNPEEVLKSDSIWKSATHEKLKLFETYLPYDGAAWQYYTNGNGDMDSTCFALSKRDSATCFTEIPDSAWMCNLTSSSSYRGEGEILISFEYWYLPSLEKSDCFHDQVTFRFPTSQNTEQIINFSWGGIGVETEVGCDTLCYMSLQQENIGAYAILIPHKGLTEFSLDGEEVWRLVERE